VQLAEEETVQYTRAASVRVAVPAVALCLCCVHTASGPMHIPLRWAPTDDSRLPAGAAEALGKQAISVDSFVDEREDPTLIGRNTQSKGVLLVTTGDDVGAFLAVRFREVLNANGVPLVARGATRVIKAEVRRYNVEEGETYKADVVLKFTVQDDSGRTLWQGPGEGHANRWGRSYSEDNYQEALCNAFLEATKDVMKNGDFLDAFRGKP
jgi:hypothetical protein